MTSWKNNLKKSSNQEIITNITTYLYDTEKKSTKAVSAKSGIFVWLVKVETDVKKLDNTSSSVSERPIRMVIFLF